MIDIYVGDLICFDCISGRHLGIVTAVEAADSDLMTYYQVAYEDRQSILPHLSVHSLILCKHCGYGRSAHTKDLKCLYGPGNWEAV